MAGSPSLMRHASPHPTLSHLSLSHGRHGILSLDSAPTQFPRSLAPLPSTVVTTYHLLTPAQSSHLLLLQIQLCRPQGYNDITLSPKPCP